MKPIKRRKSYSREFEMDVIQQSFVRGSISEFDLLPILETPKSRVSGIRGLGLDELFRGQISE
jgi:hypothetical protein